MLGKHLRCTNRRGDGGGQPADEKGDLACERYVLDNDKLQVEVLANLDKVQPAGAVVIVSYPRIEGATGLPARVWAITE